MATKTINGIEYIVYEAGMVLNDYTKSYYFENDLDYDGEIRCLHFYAIKNVRSGNQVVRGNQDVGGNQVVRGNQDVGGYQDVRGNQDVGGNQDVRYIYLHLYCKWAIRLDRDSNNIKIGCVEKTEIEWIDFFHRKDKINLAPTDKNYKKIASAFLVARQMKAHLILMNKKY